jgi:DNA-binding CsgD family transcriptional regulator
VASARPFANARGLQTHRGTPATWQWFKLLNPAGVPYADGIPSLVWCVVGRLLAAERGENPHLPARVRVRIADGSWAVIEAARLGDTRSAIAVSIHAAGAEEVLDLLSRAYSLSARERELTKLVVQGLDTGAIAKRLFISHYTVQDHLKSIFRKVGANSRLELLTGLLAQTR